MINPQANLHTNNIEMWKTHGFPSKMTQQWWGTSSPKAPSGAKRTKSPRRRENTDLRGWCSRSNKSCDQWGLPGSCELPKT